MLKVVKLEDAISKVKNLALEKLSKGENADEFVEIGEADGFKIYVAAGKTVGASVEFHENPRDVFMLVLEGEVLFLFEDGEKVLVKAGDCFVLRKCLRHGCVFKELTVVVEGVYERGL
jgi:mannose-6-phosphate isomerase-like protein (cupin superfamily)